MSKINSRNFNQKTESSLYTPLHFEPVDVDELESRWGKLEDELKKNYSSSLLQNMGQITSSLTPTGNC